MLAMEDGEGERRCRATSGEGEAEGLVGGAVPGDVDGGVAGGRGDGDEAVVAGHGRDRWRCWRVGCGEVPVGVVAEVEDEVAGLVAWM